MHVEGCTVLHGSAFVIDGRGVIVLGPSGAGKSTFAGEMRRRGHVHVSDGMSVVRLREGVAELLPGPPFARLWPDAIARLGADPSQLPRVLPDMDKRWVPITDPVADGPVPLYKIYSLHVAADESEPIQALPMPPALGMWELIRNYYLSEYIADAQKLAIFERCADLARRTRVALLTRTEATTSLEALATEVERDLEREV